jgi:hypothetical protein
MLSIHLRLGLPSGPYKASWNFNSKFAQFPTFTWSSSSYPSSYLHVTDLEESFNVMMWLIMNSEPETFRKSGSFTLEWAADPVPGEFGSASGIALTVFYFCLQSTEIVQKWVPEAEQ